MYLILSRHSDTPGFLVNSRLNSVSAHLITGHSEEIDAKNEPGTHMESILQTGRVLPSPRSPADRPLVV